MPAFDPSSLDRYAAALPERPATFAERGVAMPFTTPMLAAARLRRGADGLPELLLPALGGRGVYILGWEACLGLCGPTLHDRGLWAELAGRTPSPAAVRDAARRVALRGLAGRAARAAAEARLAAGGDRPAGRMAALEALARTLEAWAGAAVTPADRRAALLVCGAARLTLAALAANLDTEARADWLLDGWDGLAALAAEAPSAERRAALHDMLAALPVLPAEVEAWPGPTADWNALLRAARGLSPCPSWVSTGRVPLVARNERLRALAA
jgi:hypothetical protein